MRTTERKLITVEATVNAPVERVWTMWTEPEHITQWNFASNDWQSPIAENDLREGGKFNYRMEAKDGSSGFDFGGEYDKVEPNNLIEYTLGDGRRVKIVFRPQGDKTLITQSFEAEETNPVEMQQTGWQAILDNFKWHAENSGKTEKLSFEVSIKADIEKVYNTMLDKKHYSEWTSEFNPSSKYEGSWEKGSKILFIGTDSDGNKGGMVSRIKENIPYEQLSIEHLGIIKGEQEITSGPEVEGWAGALEEYFFKEMDGHTLVRVEMDSVDSFKSYFVETWPKALNALKRIVENN